jgi:hypothetical protein
MKFFFVASMALCLSAHLSGQCLVQKTGQQYGFFRVTNFKEKICWLSEPFAYKVVNNEVANYNDIKDCFKQKVKVLGGNVDHDVDEFGKEKVVWLNNSYDPKAVLEDSYNWNLPSAKACLKYINGEISYKTGVGIQVKIVKMFSNGLINSDELHK